MMEKCRTVKSVEEELNKPNAFVNQLTYIQKLEEIDRTFFLQGENYGEKESWIGALGKESTFNMVRESNDQTERDDRRGRRRCLHVNEIVYIY